MDHPLFALLIASGVLVFGGWFVWGGVATTSPPRRAVAAALFTVAALIPVPSPQPFAGVAIVGVSFALRFAYMPRRDLRALLRADNRS